MNWGAERPGPVDHGVRARQPRLRGGGGPPLRHLDAGSRRARPRHRPRWSKTPPPLVRIRGASPARLLAPRASAWLRSPPCSAPALPRQSPSWRWPASPVCPPPTGPRRALSACHPLHAEPDAARGGRIVDARGREVLLRGVNVNALAEYWKGTAFRTVFPLARERPARMAAIGWNTVRLLRLLVAGRARTRASTTRHI